MMRVEIDGNDGVGKSTLVRSLAQYGLVAQDRGRMTMATDNDSVGPEEGVLYILLDAPWAVCYNRLRGAGKDTTEKYHTPEDLWRYGTRFRVVAERFSAHIVHAESETQTLVQTMGLILGRSLRMGVPKGRLLGDASVLLKGMGFSFNFDGRKLVSHSCGVDATLLKPRSIPQLIAMGHLDAGLMGYDVLLDSPYQDLLEVVGTTDLAPVRLVAAASDPNILRSPPSRPLVVATEYSHLADRWLTDMGLSHVILHTHGSTEAFCPRFADLVIDVVETGDTLNANNLVQIHEFARSSLVLVRRRAGAPHQVDVIGRALRD